MVYKRGKNNKTKRNKTKRNQNKKYKKRTNSKKMRGGQDEKPQQGSLRLYRDENPQF